MSITSSIKQKKERKKERREREKKSLALNMSIEYLNYLPSDLQPKPFNIHPANPLSESKHTTQSIAQVMNRSENCLPMYPQPPVCAFVLIFSLNLDELL